MIYILCFGISTMLAYFANKTKSRLLFVLFSAASIFVAVALAGLRDYSIGIDTVNYMTMARFWGGALKRETLGAYLSYYMSLGYNEPLFALLVGLVEHYTGNFTVFLFATHTVIMTGVYIGAFRQRRHANPVLILLLFYLCFYNHSLNIMRQYMAMAVVFAALADIEQKKYLRFIIIVIIARYIHTSALLALGAVLLHWMMYGKFTRAVPSLAPSWRARVNVIVGGLAVLVFFFPWLCRLLIQVGILQKKYAFFLNSDEAGHSTLITLFLIFELCVVFVFRKQMKKRLPYASYFMVSSVAYLILHQLSATIVYGKRIAAYYSLANLVTIGMIPQSFTKKQNRVVATALVVFVAIFYWWYTYALRNGSATYPYISIFASA